MAEMLRSGNDDVQAVRITFGSGDKSGCKGVMRRLIQVSTALELDSKAKGPSRYVTKVSTDFSSGCVVVDAVVTTATTAEALQKDILALVPPATSATDAASGESHFAISEPPNG